MGEDGAFTSKDPVQAEVCPRFYIDASCRHLENRKVCAQKHSSCWVGLSWSVLYYLYYYFLGAGYSQDLILDHSQEMSGTFGLRPNLLEGIAKAYLHVDAGLGCLATAQR